MSLYHGTRIGVTKGALLLPGDQFDKDNHGLGRSDRVYLTTDLGLAWDYAEAASGRGRPKVCEVMPLGPLSVDDSTVGGDEQDSYVTDAAVVVRVIERPS